MTKRIKRPTTIMVNGPMDFADTCDFYIGQLEFVRSGLPVYRLKSAYALTVAIQRLKSTKRISAIIDKHNKHDPFKYERINP